jgi:flavin-dependent dehydrogenase
MKPSTERYDAVVVGAGVAGGCAAALLADRGWRVLLVEKSAWPRVTVCGGCLCASALDTLHEMGMQSVASDAMPTHSVSWHTGRKTFSHVIPQGAAVLRVNLDAAIISEAVRRGVEFMPGCCANLLPASASDAFRSLKLQTNDRTIEIHAGVVIACDGLDGTLLKDEPWAKWKIVKNGLIGVAATYQRDSCGTPSGQIHMCMGKPGYVGLVRIDDSTEHLAAALYPGACRDNLGPLNLISEILRSCHQPVPTGLAAARMYGTGKLTRRRKHLGGHRVLTVGDACGYVEPVTGEGMAWAIHGAFILNQIIPASCRDWPENLAERWRDRHSCIIGRQQRWCRAMRTTMHNPAMTAAGIFLGNAFPGMARWIACMVCEPKKKEFLNDPIGRVSQAKDSERIGTLNSGHRHREPTGGPAGTVASAGAGTGDL